MTVLNCIIFCTVIKYNYFLTNEVTKLVDTEETPNFKMLEIKNVTKIYKTKGGAETRALYNVSISF